MIKTHFGTASYDLVWLILEPVRSNVQYFGHWNSNDIFMLVTRKMTTTYPYFCNTEET